VQINFPQEEKFYLWSVLAGIMSSKGLPRRERRNIQRLLNKFLPNAQEVHLKPKDVTFLCSVINYGLMTILQPTESDDQERLAKKQAIRTMAISAITSLGGTVTAASPEIKEQVAEQLDEAVANASK
jgi:hypothetical protein